MNTPELLVPDWPVPDGVIARVSNRHGGVSHAPFDGFNLALHVDDLEFATSVLNSAGFVLLWQDSLSR